MNFTVTIMRNLTLIFQVVFTGAVTLSGESCGLICATLAWSPRNRAAGAA